jgi:hypothetical protein
MLLTESHAQQDPVSFSRKDTDVSITVTIVIMESTVAGHSARLITMLSRHEILY